MREKPPLQDKRLIACLRHSYGLEVTRLEFLPLGADYNSAVYRVESGESISSFLKLRKENFEQTSLIVPKFLHEQGIRQVIPPRKTVDGRLWSALDAYTCILYPFIDGRDGFEVSLSDEQWIEFGAALEGIHSVILPPDLQDRIPSESFSPYWRKKAEYFLLQVDQVVYKDPLAAQMASIIRKHRKEIRFLIKRAAELAATLKSQPIKRVLCHSDIHAGNLLIAENARLYIIDWDNPILAPKERDLMFIGGGVGSIWNTAREEALFYQSYGSHDLDLTALVYYRYERIVQDIGAFCEQILLNTEGEADRQLALHYLKGQFLPGEVFEIACQTDQKLKGA
jgi:spectinomycin phosphotransferase